MITIIIAIVIIYMDFFLVMGMGGDLSLFSGGANFHAFLFALVDNIISMGVIFIMFKVFYAKFNKQGSILRNLSASAFYMYLVHPPIVVTLSLLIASINLYASGYIRK